MFFDYHIHSQFSPDSRLNLQEICALALKNGLEEIAITDHHDLDYQDPDIVFDIDRASYLLALEELQKEYAGILRIRKGLELGLQPHILAESRKFVGDYFDFVLGSFHTIQKKDLYQGHFFQGYSQWQAYREYLKDILYCVQNYEHFNVIGHIDVIRRYGDFSVIPDLTEDLECEELLREIFKILVEKGKGLEVNTSGYYIANSQDPMPTKKVLKLYLEMGGEVLTTGSDSHTPVQIGYKFRETHQLLLDLGFKYLTTFEKGKPIFHKIE